MLDPNFPSMELHTTYQLESQLFTDSVGVCMHLRQQSCIPEEATDPTAAPFAMAV